MTIHVVCDECGKGYRIPDEKAGRKVRCRQCEAVIRIPVLEEDYDEYGYEDDSYEDEYEAPAPKREKSTIRKRGKSKSNGNTGLIIGASAVGALLLIGVTAAFMMSGDDNDAAEPDESVAAADPAEPDLVRKLSVTPDPKILSGDDDDAAEPGESVAAAETVLQPGTSGWLVGVWRTDPVEAGPIVFTDDGTARVHVLGSKFTWSLSGTTLSMTRNGKELPDMTLSNVTKNAFTMKPPKRLQSGQTGTSQPQTVHFTRIIPRGSQSTPAKSDLVRKLSVTPDPKILALARIKRSPFCRPSSFTMSMAGNSRAIKDGTNNTILVGSVPADHAIPWTKPDDLVYRSDFPAPGHPGGFDGGYFCFANSSVRWVELDIIPEKFRGLLTARGGESVDKLYPQTRTGVPELTPEMIKRRSRDSNNLKQIGVAILNYHGNLRHYPVAFLLGPDGKPWHSWRVLLLWHLGEKDLYEEYDMTVPWNHPKNLELLDQMPGIYADPFADNPSRTHTKYVAITGSETAFPRTFRLDTGQFGSRPRFDAEVKKLFDSQGLPVPTWVEQYIEP